MNTRLLRGLSPELKDEFKVRFKEENLVLDQLIFMLEKDLEESLVNTSSKDALSSPNYLAYQAWRNGEQNTLRNLITILKDKS